MREILSPLRPTEYRLKYSPKLSSCLSSLLFFPKQIHISLVLFEKRSTSCRSVLRQRNFGSASGEKLSQCNQLTVKSSHSEYISAGVNSPILLRPVRMNTCPIHRPTRIRCPELFLMHARHLPTMATRKVK
jgi:hypothetical protein